MALDRRHLVSSASLHLKIRHHAPHPLVALLLLLTQEIGRDRRGRWRRERDRRLQLGRGLRSGLGLDRRHGRHGRGGGLGGRSCGDSGRGRLLPPEIVEHAAGELRAGHVGVAAVPEHGVAADDVGGGALAGQQAHRAGAALLVREIERRRVDLEPGAAQHAGVIGCQARSGLGGCGLVVWVAEAHGGGGAGDELERPGRPGIAVEQAGAVGALDRADAGEVALRQVVLLLEALVQRAELGGVGARARPAAGSHAGDAVEGAVHGGHALLAAEVRIVEVVGVDGAAHGVALDHLLVLLRRHRGCAQAADRRHRAHGERVVDRMLFLADADRPDAVAELDVALRRRAEARLGLCLGVARQVDALRVLGREGVVVLAPVVDRDQRRDVGVAFGGLDPLPAGGALEQVRLRLRRALAGRAGRQVGRGADQHGRAAVGPDRDARGLDALAAHVARSFAPAHLEVSPARLELEVAQERLVVRIGRIEEPLGGGHDRAGRALGDGRCRLGRRGGGDGASECAEELRPAHAVTWPQLDRVGVSRPAAVVVLAT